MNTHTYIRTKGSPWWPFGICIIGAILLLMVQLGHPVDHNKAAAMKVLGAILLILGAIGTVMLFAELHGVEPHGSADVWEALLEAEGIVMAKSFDGSRVWRILNSIEEFQELYNLDFPECLMERLSYVRRRTRRAA